MTEPSTQEEFQCDLSSSDLCLPIYLDQQIVFDMLAVLDDGLVNVSEVRSVAGRSDSEGNIVKASFRARFVELINIGVGASRHVEGTDTNEREICETRIHTSASLFCKLRSQLFDKHLVREIFEAGQLEDIAPGDFVEIVVRLEKNPVVETLDRLVKILEFSRVFQITTPPPTVSAKGRGDKGQRPPNESPQDAIFQQLKRFHEQITESDSIDVIGKSVVSTEITAVVSLKRDLFVRSESEFIGNVFSIFGKAANVITPEEVGSINLLSRTTLAGINTQVIQTAFGKIKNAEAMGFDLPNVITEVEGPALQIIPIAVFL